MRARLRRRHADHARGLPGRHPVRRRDCNHCRPHLCAPAGIQACSQQHPAVVKRPLLPGQRLAAQLPDGQPGCVPLGLRTPGAPQPWFGQQLAQRVVRVLRLAHGRRQDLWPVCLGSPGHDSRCAACAVLPERAAHLPVSGAAVPAPAAARTRTAPSTCAAAAGPARSVPGRVTKARAAWCRRAVLRRLCAHHGRGHLPVPVRRPELSAQPARPGLCALCGPLLPRWGFGAAWNAAVHLDASHGAWGPAAAGGCPLAAARRLHTRTHCRLPVSPGQGASCQLQQGPRAAHPLHRPAWQPHEPAPPRPSLLLRWRRHGPVHPLLLPDLRGLPDASPAPPAARAHRGQQLQRCVGAPVASAPPLDSQVLLHSSCGPARSGSGALLLSCVLTCPVRAAICNILFSTAAADALIITMFLECAPAAF